MELPGHVKALAPGMSQVIEAGETYTITDTNGVELELIGRIDKATLAFVRAFVLWHDMQQRGVEGEIIKHAWFQLASAYENLPNHVRKELIR